MLQLVNKALYAPSGNQPRAGRGLQEIKNPDTLKKLLKNKQGIVNIPSAQIPLAPWQRLKGRLRLRQ